MSSLLRPWGRAGALATLLALLAQAGGAPLAAEAKLRPFTIASAYHEAREDGVCSKGKRRDIHGFLPAGSGKAPVFVYLTGTVMRFNGADGQKLTREMARRGFVAATVDYDNSGYPYCDGMMEKAACVWGDDDAKGALAKLCAHPRADCDGGIVVSGFSQGANLASVAKNFDARVRGAYLLGHGHKATTIKVTPCMQDSATKLGPAEMRSVNAEADFFLGRNQVRVRKQLETVVGVKCDGKTDCEAGDGGGWHIVQAADVADGKPDHCYFFNEADIYCAKFDGFDPGWEDGTHPWSLGPSLDWLAGRVEPPK